MSILNITFDLETCALCFTAAVMSIEAVAWNANAEDNPFTDGFSGDYCFIATLTCAYRSSTDLLAAPAALQSARKTTNGINYRRLHGSDADEDYDSSHTKRPRVTGDTRICGKNQLR